MLPFKPPLALWVPAYMICFLPQAPTSFLMPSPCLCSCLSVLSWFFQTHHCLPCLRPFCFSGSFQWTKFYFSYFDSNLFFSSLFKCCFLKTFLNNNGVRYLVMWTYSILYFLLALCYLEFMGSQWIYFNCMFNAYFIHLILNFIRPELILSCSTL